MKFYGGNITAAGPHHADWTVLFAEWDWAGLVRPQVDAIHVIGGNCVRLFGDPHAVFSSAITLQDYLDCWTQLVEYCAEAGMTVYPCGYAGIFREGMTVAQLLDVLTPWADHLQSLQVIYGNIVGLDICNEASYANGASPAEAATLYAALKAMTSIPLTFSDFTTSQGGAPWNISATHAAYVPYCDLLDFHNYGTSGASPLALTNIVAAYPTKDIIFGEWGTPVSAGEAARVAHTNNTLAMAQHARCIGALCWSIFNYDTPTSNQYGMYPGKASPPYPLLASAFSTGIVPVPPPPPPPPALVRDEFTGSGLLHGRTPDIGQAWAASGLTIGNGTLTGNGTGTIAAVGGTPNNVEATIEFVAGSCQSGHNAGIYLRENVNGKYLLRFRAESMSGNTINGRWEIYRYTTYWECPQGAANVAGSLNIGSSYVLKAIANGSSLTLQASENGGGFATKASWTDSTHASGNCGVHLWESGGLPITRFEVQ